MTLTGQRCRYRRRGFANQGLLSRYVSEWNGVNITDGDFKLTACSTIAVPMAFGLDARVTVCRHVATLRETDATCQNILRSSLE